MKILLLIGIFLASLIPALVFTYLFSIKKTKTTNPHINYQEKAHPWPYILMLSIATLLYLAAGAKAYQSIHFIQNSTLTDATLIAYQTSTDTDSDPYHYPIYRYQDQQGKQHQNLSHWGSHQPYKKRQITPLRYHNHKPHISRLDRHSSYWGASYTLAAVATIALLLGLLLRWWSNREYHWLQKRLAQVPPKQTAAHKARQNNTAPAGEKAT